MGSSLLFLVTILESNNCNIPAGITAWLPIPHQADTPTYSPLQAMRVLSPVGSADTARRCPGVVPGSYLPHKPEITTRDSSEHQGSCLVAPFQVHEE
ncbi:transmembrane protein 100 isoform X3 [Dendrobates tinctorius]|uniref:transmembrane protein 100 isoform X3 n=1 Tax=Dendrobates tinctorius TaxID=92724 RepID=UPI003CC9AC24